MSDRVWVRAKVINKTYPFDKKDVVWITKNEEMTLSFVKANVVVLQPSKDLKHHCFMLKPVLPHYFQALGKEEDKSVLRELDKCWKMIVNNSTQPPLPKSKKAEKTNALKKPSRRK